MSVVRAADLPVGTYVRVTERDRGREYVGRVVGYDMARSKYQIGARYPGWGQWEFVGGGSWAFPSEVQQISEAEALRVGDGGEQEKT